MAYSSHVLTLMFAACVGEALRLQPGRGPDPQVTKCSVTPHTYINIGDGGCFQFLQPDGEFQNSRAAAQYEEAFCPFVGNHERRMALMSWYYRSVDLGEPPLAVNDVAMSCLFDDIGTVFDQYGFRLGLVGWSNEELCETMLSLPLMFESIGFDGPGLIMEDMRTSTVWTFKGRKVADVNRGRAGPSEGCNSTFAEHLGPARHGRLALRALLPTYLRHRYDAGYIGPAALRRWGDRAIARGRVPGAMVAASDPPGLICIDSDDEGGDAANGSAIHEELAAMLDSLPPPSDRLLCQLMLPRAPGTSGRSSGSSPAPMMMVAEVEVRLEYARDDGIEPELELLRVPTDGQGSFSSRVPFSLITRLEVRSLGHMVVLRTSPPMYTTEFLSSADLANLGTSSFGEVEEIALIPRPNEVKVALATFRLWFPQTEVLSPSRQQRRLTAEDDAVLRLDTISLTSRDIDLLEDEQFVNDSVLDFFLRLVLDVVAPKHLKDGVYLASSFFFQKLTSGGVANGEEGWENVRRWRSLKGGLLAQRFVVVPINELNVHWWVAIVCNPRHAFEADGTPSTMGSMPRIVCLDSAVDAPTKSKAVGFLRGYFWKECCERQAEKGHVSNDRLKKLQTAFILKALIADVPKQANGYDCGIFIIEYLSHLLQSESALQALGLAPHRHWFSQDAVSHRRRRLRWLASTLREEAKRRGEPDVGRLLEDPQLRAAVIAALTDKPVRPPREKSKPSETSECPPEGRVVASTVTSDTSARPGQGGQDGKTSKGAKSVKDCKSDTGGKSGKGGKGGKSAKGGKVCSLPPAPARIGLKRAHPGDAEAAAAAVEAVVVTTPVAEAATDGTEALPAARQAKGLGKKLPLMAKAKPPAGKVQARASTSRGSTNPSVRRGGSKQGAQ